MKGKIMDLFELIGICFTLYWCARVMILNSIRAYKEIYLSIHQSSKEIQEKTASDKLEYQFNEMKGK